MMAMMMLACFLRGLANEGSHIGVVSECNEAGCIIVMLSMHACAQSVAAAFPSLVAEIANRTGASVTRSCHLLAGPASKGAEKPVPCIMG